MLLLFNVIGYIKDFDLFLLNVKKNLKRNSLLIFDFWHEAGVKYAGPKKTIKKFSSEGLELHRNSSGKESYKKMLLKLT